MEFLKVEDDGTCTQIKDHEPYDSDLQMAYEKEAVLVRFRGNRFEMAEVERDEDGAYEYSWVAVPEAE